MNAVSPTRPAASAFDPIKLDEGEPDTTTLMGVLTALSRARGKALMVGTLALLAATAADDRERQNAVENMRLLIDRFRSNLESLQKQSRKNEVQVNQEFQIALGFPTKVEELARARTLDRGNANTIIWLAWDTVVPALQKITWALVKADIERDAEQGKQLAERSASVLSMCDEMAGIGRTVQLISLNAAVEAARAGGESGQVFGTIAQEVRTLANRASDVVARTRSQLEDST